MDTSRFSRFRPHFMSASLVCGIVMLMYGTYRTAIAIKVWSNKVPRSQHQEMEDFLAYKEIQAYLKSVKQ